MGSPCAPPTFECIGRTMHLVSALHLIRVHNVSMTCSQNFYCISAGVPSGYFWSRGRVLACSRGTYRAGDLPTTDSAATVCKPCGPGIATSGPMCKATGNTTACTDVRACNRKCNYTSKQLSGAADGAETHQQLPLWFRGNNMAFWLPLKTCRGWFKSVP